jgi:hypothetical protein
MRLLKWTLVAAWLAAHAWLWMLLPPLPRWQIPSVLPHSIAFTPDGRSLVTADGAEVIVWDATTGQRERTIPRASRRPNEPDRQAVLIMSPTDRRAIVYGAGGNLSQRPYLIDLDSGKTDALSTFADMIPGDRDDTVIGFLPGGRAAFQLAAWLNDGRSVAMRLWDLPDGPPRVLWIESRLYHDPSFSANGRRAVIVPHKPQSPQGTVQIIDLVNARIAHTVPFDGKVVRAELSADGRTLAVSICPLFEGGAWGLPKVELWDAESDQRIQTLGPGLCRGWNAAGQLVVLDEQNVRLLRVPDGAEVARWSSPQISGVFSGDLTAGSRVLTIAHTHFLPQPVQWLFEHLPGQLFDPAKSTERHSVFDAQTGRELTDITTGTAKQVVLTADGSAVAFADAVGLWVYDVPPRKADGIVLGLLVVEVCLLVVWTARRRLVRNRAEFTTNTDDLG